jgi:hypothetical protein
MGLAPLAGAAMLGFLFVKSVLDLSDPDNSYSGEQVLGVGTPLAIGLGFLLLGGVLAVLWRLAGHRRFFGRQGLEAVDPAVAEGRVPVQATV